MRHPRACAAPLALFAALALAPPATAASISATADGGPIVFTGAIEAGDARELKRVLGRAPKSRLLVVNSPGGSHDDAIELGKLIFEAGLDIRVESQCFSACANFLFPAARHKTVTKDSVLCYHGSLDRDAEDVIERLKISLAEAPELAKIAGIGEPLETWAAEVAAGQKEDLVVQRAFLARIGVAEDLLYPGVMRMPRIIRREHDDYARWIVQQQVGWCPSPEALERYGVRDLSMWYPSTDAELERLGRHLNPSLLLLRTRRADPDPGTTLERPNDPPAVATRTGLIQVVSMLEGRGDRFAHDKAYARAIAQYDAAIRVLPTSSVLIARGRAYSAMDQTEAAIRDFDRALELWPDSELALRLRGTAWSAKGDTRRAIADLDAAIHLAPSAGAFFARGRARLLAAANKTAPQGTLDRAIADFDEAIRRRDDFPDAYFFRGAAYDLKGDPDRAIQNFTETIRRDPSFLPARVDRGKAFAEKGQFDLAIADYEGALARDPKYVRALAARGLARAANGDLKRAIEDYDQALLARPDDRATLLSRGQAKLYAGAAPAAAADLAAAVKQDPADGEAVLWLHLARWRAGEPDGDELAGALHEAKAGTAKMRPTPVSANAAPEPLHPCAADFFAAVLALQHGRPAEAQPLFSAAAQRCPPPRPERWAARAELARLKLKPRP